MPTRPEICKATALRLPATRGIEDKDKGLRYDEAHRGDCLGYHQCRLGRLWYSPDLDAVVALRGLLPKKVASRLCDEAKPGQIMISPCADGG